MTPEEKEEYDNSLSPTMESEMIHNTRGGLMMI
jgi:hypothetical protein